MRYLILTLLIYVATCAYAQTFVIASDFSKKPVESARCVLYNEHNDSIGYTTSTADGVARCDNQGTISMEIFAKGYGRKYVNLSSLKSDTIFLHPVKTLDEVVVLPENVRDLGNKKSYRIPMSDMNRYTNFYQALNEIPHLTILSSGGAYFEGSSDIAFLLNGVETTVAELQTIAKEDISRIDVFDNPPARFAAQGKSAVIDVRTKSDITGGNIGVNIDQAFHPVKGENSAALYFNNRRSRFSLIYYGDNSHYDKFIQNENLEYTFDNVEYKKTKTGIGSDADTDDNDLLLSYQNNIPDNYLYNLQLGVGFNRNKMNLSQDATSDDDNFAAVNFLRTKYNKYNVANYFEKHFGDDGDKGTLLANVNYQHFDTRYISSYKESPEFANNDAVNNHSEYQTMVDGLFAEVQYEFPYNKLGYFSASVVETYKHSRYADAVSPFYQTTNIASAFVVWTGTRKKLTWYAKLGLSASHIATTSLKESYDIVIPNPMVMLTWQPNDKLFIRGRYSYSLNTPSIAQLSETDQWLDTKLVYHGNSTLKAAKTHSFAIQSGFNNRFINAFLSVNYHNSPEKICSQYLTTDKYMLETIVNLDSFHEFSGMMNLSVMPLGNNKLVFTSAVIAGNVRGKNACYSWSGYRFQWMSELSLNLNKWTVSAFYQYPGKVADGQLIRPRAECWLVTAYYRPVSNLSVGLKWFMPFGKSFHESEHTVKDSPVYFDKHSVIDDGANFIALELSWNLSFGRNQNKARPKFGNGDNDSGLLKK